MARIDEMANPELKMVESQDAEGPFELGLFYANGDGGRVDLIAAHKWFNIAAMRGYPDAVFLRHQIAEEMSTPEIAAAQRAAREWLRQH
jgi:TPR repeat protein